MTGVRALYATAKGSAIRELLALAAEPGVISLAGGMPDPALLPLLPLREAFDRALTDRALLQYGPTDGLPACKHAIARVLDDRLGPHTGDDWLLTSGSQQALDLIARTLLDPGDVVAVEAHAYPAALQAFRFSGARIVGLATDEEGLQPQALAELLQREPVKAVYLVPSFGNPSGALMGRARRLALLQVLAGRGTLLIEDDPYRELWFDALPSPTLHRLNAELGLGVELAYLTSFSKTVAPALRVGALLAPPALRRAIVLAKQAADIHSARIDQAVLAGLLDGDWFEAHLAALRAHYAAKGRALHVALQQHAGEVMDWQAPRGGMFIWGRLRRPLPGMRDCKPLMREHRVLFVPGVEFAADGQDAGHLRLSFANPTIEQLGVAADRLAALLRAAHEAAPIAARAAE